MIITIHIWSCSIWRSQNLQRWTGRRARTLDVTHWREIKFSFNLRIEISFYDASYNTYSTFDSTTDWPERWCVSEPVCGADGRLSNRMEFEYFTLNCQLSTPKEWNIVAYTHASTPLVEWQVNNFHRQGSKSTKKKYLSHIANLSVT